MPDIRLDRIPRGWHTLVNTANRCLTPDGATHAGKTGAITNIEIVEHRLALETAEDTAFNRGVIEAARSLSAEVCCVCGGKALPLVDWNGEPARTRCLLQAGQVDVAPVHIRGEWLDYTLTGRFDYLTENWLAIPEGWAGLGRAMLTTLCEEPEEPEPDERPNARRWRIRFKEMLGRLEVHGTHGTRFRQGAEQLVQELSKRVCIRCGMPGAMRMHDFMRPECDNCWQHTDGCTYDDPTVRRTQREPWTSPDAIGV
ncbi:MAG: hypothetical protein F4137_02440 [Acidobacteria bacterium]|nr:hypothetical protein [Acidobacteriota bacterium]MYH27715.1 hypothetical protein [Acidobacteriota bacterium]